jgi:hypothetical protein
MALNAAKVLVGTADQQSTTGAVRSGAVVATVPTTFALAETAANGLTASGYVSEDGMELTNDISTTEIREWNRSIVRKVLDTFNGEITLTLIQSDYESWVQALGSEYVTRTAATSTKGEQLTIAMGAHLAPVQSFAFMLKDGDARAIVFVPRGQVTTLDTITFSATEAIALPITVSCYDDGTGNSIYIFLDDGQKTSGQ